MDGGEGWDHGAEGILRQTLTRLQKERDEQARLVEDYREALQIARLMHAEATVAVEAVQKLLGGELYRLNDLILADDVSAASEPAAFDWSAIEYPVAEAADASEEPGKPQIEPAPPVAEPEPPPQPAAQPEPRKERKTLTFQERRSGKAAAFQREDEDRLLSALVKLSDAFGEVQISLSALAEASGIPTGSMTFVVRRAVDAGQVVVTKNFRPGSRTPAPSTYRLIRPEPAVAPAPKRPATPIKDTTIPTTPAPAPPKADQALRIPVDMDEADMPGWWPQGSLLALKMNNCRWPTNSPPAGSGEEARFCSADTDGGVYCAEHQAKTHGRGA